MKVIDECLRRGHSAKIFTLRWEAPQPDNLEVEVLPIIGLSRHRQYEYFAQAVAQALSRETFDLVVGFNKMPGLDVYYAGDSCYMEKSLTQRGFWYRWLPRFKSFVRAERAVFGHDARTEILMLSEDEIPLYREHYQTSIERLHMLPPGIERDRIAPPDIEPIRQQLRAELGLSDEQLMLLFIGSGFIKKGLDRALEAIAALPEALAARVHFYVIGRNKATAFERMAQRLGIRDRVTFFAQGRDDVPRFLFSADGLIHPAYDETAGMVILEALLATLPVLVTANCGYARYIADYNAGIVVPTPFSQAQLNNDLQRLLSSAERDAWRASGRRAAADDALFGLVPKTVDYLEQFAGET